MVARKLSEFVKNVALIIKMLKVDIILLLMRMEKVPEKN